MFPEHDATHLKLKSVLSSAQILRFYETNSLTTLQIDVSKSFLGTCMLQQNQPVAYALSALSDSEVNYAQIEKQMLAIVYGCERFNMYTYGTETDVLADHKPLESVFKTPIYKLPAHLQKMSPSFAKV